MNLNPSQAVIDTSSQEVIQGIQSDILSLRAQCQIQHLTDISQLINPPEEEVADEVGDVDEMLLALHAPTEEQESDSEPTGQLPTVTLNRCFNTCRVSSLVRYRQMAAMQSISSGLRDTRR
jgi:hypothetical protein